MWSYGKLLVMVRSAVGNAWELMSQAPAVLSEGQGEY